MFKGSPRVLLSSFCCCRCFSFSRYCECHKPGFMIWWFWWPTAAKTLERFLAAFDVFSFRFVSFFFFGFVSSGFSHSWDRVRDSPPNRIQQSTANDHKIELHRLGPDRHGFHRRLLFFFISWLLRRFNQLDRILPDFIGCNWAPMGFIASLVRWIFYLFIFRLPNWWMVCRWCR